MRFGSEASKYGRDIGDVFDSPVCSLKRVPEGKGTIFEENSNLVS
jgi:hypothetical protein